MENKIYKKSVTYAKLLLLLHIVYWYGALWNFTWDIKADSRAAKTEYPPLGSFCLKPCVKWLKIVITALKYSPVSRFFIILCKEVINNKKIKPNYSVYDKAINKSDISGQFMQKLKKKPQEFLVIYPYYCIVACCINKCLLKSAEVK